MNFIVVNGDYEYTEIGLFFDTQLIDSIKKSHRSTSSHLIPSMHNLLERNKLTIDDLDFIAANTGPGPFTTLRVTLATVNGISFAISKPLVSVDSLVGLLSEYAQPNQHTVALYNAFAQEAFFAIAFQNNALITGYAHINTVLNEIRTTLPEHETVRFIGKGADLYSTHIESALGSRACIDKSVSYCSLQEMGKQAYATYQKTAYPVYKLEPCYLKKPHYKQAISKQ
jgi:tRNA threonylcarbamoyladenosine biosynthesis protein TsaB